MNFKAGNIKGLFARGTPDECPPDRLLQATNIMASGPNLVPRPGFALPTFGEVPTNRVSSHLSIFEPLPTAGVLTPYLISQDYFAIFGGYPIWNAGNIAIGPFIYLAIKPYHSWINFFGRGYFTLHDTIIGSQTEFVQVYEGGNSSRPAAGVKPASTMAGVLSGTPGNLAVGIYLVDVSFITVSGFVTKPSGHVVQVSSFGAGSIDLTVIPTGAAGVVAKRQIVATKAINLSTYTGNPNDYEFFDVPNALINDNVTVAFNLSFFDGNLISSADPRQDILEQIPCGVGIGEFNGRALVWGEYANNSIVRVSDVGEPESFSATSGLIVVDPTESGGVTNCIGFNGQLYITKGSRVFIAIDNGDVPSSWSVLPYDAGIGTETYGVSQVLDSKGKHLNQFLLATRQGLVLFDGIVRMPELTYWIEDIWKDIDPTQFSKVQVLINPRAHHVYVFLPRNGGVTQILLGDFSDGLNPDTIKWYIWSGAAGTLTSLVLMTRGNNSIVMFTSDLLQVSEFDLSNFVSLDYGANFNCTLQTPPIITNPDDMIQQFTRVGIRQIGGGPTDISIKGQSADDSTKVTSSIVMPFLNAPTRLQTKAAYLPFVDKLPTVVITMVSGNKPKLSRLDIDTDTYGEDEP